MTRVGHLSVRFSGFNVLQMQTDMRKLRYLKNERNVMVTENHRGSSFYTPHRFVQQLLRELYLNLSFLVLSFQAVLWQKKKIKSNRANWRESSHRCLSLFAVRFCSVFLTLRFFSFSAERAAASGILKSKKFISLHHR